LLFATNSNILIVHIQFTLRRDVISLIVINNDVTCSNIFIGIVSHHIFEAICSGSPFSSTIRQVNKYLMPYSFPSNLQIYYLYLGQSECWTRSYVRGHWFRCSLSLRPGTPLYSPWTLASSALSLSLTQPNKQQQR
jgi:hypothetical protein